ncbi:MAG: hypothetical protein MI919_36140 [Holophagales bacterium]|nr:hypothetical protein [Holophagales bacterium]
MERRAALGAEEPLILRAETRYLPAADGASVEAEQRGFVVERRWGILPVESGSQEPPRRVELGEPAEVALEVGQVVEEHLRVTLAEDRTFVAVVVPLAAGVEALNPALATAPPEAVPEGRASVEPTYADFRDDHVAFYFDELSKGTHDLYFRARASTVGRFVQPPARAEAMYEMSAFGRSAGARVVVERVGDARAPGESAR